MPLKPWHAGRTVGKTLYDGDGPDDMIGVMMTRDLAAQVVAEHNEIASLRAQVAALTVERVRLHDALIQYGAHEPGCDAPYWRISKLPGVECTCGYWAAMDRAWAWEEANRDQ